MKITGSWKTCRKIQIMQKNSSMDKKVETDLGSDAGHQNRVHSSQFDVHLETLNEQDRIKLELGVAKGLNGTVLSIRYYCKTSKIDQIEPISENNPK
jgi:hypothetical protein